MSKTNNKRDTSPLFSSSRLNQLIRHLSIHIAVLMLILTYYWFEWGHLSGFITAVDRGNHFMQDFTNYYYPMSQQIFHAPKPVLGYYYSSFFALILSPLGAMKISSAIVFWGVIQFACLAALFFMSFYYLPKLSPTISSLYLLLFITSFPILNNIKWGQVSLMITTFVIAASILLHKNRPVAAGIFLAFITAIKFYPIIFISLFIIKRENRSLAAFFISMLIFYIVLPASILGLPNWLEFEKITSAEIAGAGWVNRDINSQYFSHVGLRWFELLFGRKGGNLIEGILSTSGIVIAFFCLVSVWLFEKRSSAKTSIFSFAAIFASMPFLIKTSWPHYFVYLPFFQGILLHYYIQKSKKHGKIKGEITFPLTSIILSSIFFFNLFPNWSIYNSHGTLFFSNLFLLLGVCSVLISGILKPCLTQPTHHLRSD